MKLDKKDSRFKQGIFTPMNREKYKGRDYPRYLSSWELKFFRFCDSESSVLEWSSESIIIPYLNPVDNRVHNYITDAVIKMKTRDGVKKFLVEVKPHKQTIKPLDKVSKKTGKPLKSSLYEKLTFIKNTAKWDAEKNGAKNMIWNLQ